MDSDFNVLWNKKYFLAPGYSTALKGGFNDIELSQDGYLYGLTVGTTVVAGVATSATASLVKINPSNGDIVWQKDRPKPVWAGKTPWADTWDEGSGPRIDSEGNIYISYSVGCGRNKNNGQQIVPGPITIVKYDPDGNELWSVVDDLIEGRTLCFTFPTYEDSWEMVVDSENSVYVDSSYWITSAINNMGYATTKYNKDGNFQWRDIKDYTGDWDSPRSLSIDNDDYIYVNGNPPISQGLSCNLRKLGKDGSVLIEGQNLNPTGTAADFSYCWGAVVDKFDRWVSVGNNVGKLSMAYYRKSGESTMVLESLINYDLTMMTGTQGLHKTSIDKFGNVYSVMPRFINGSSREQTAILKSKNTYPNTMPATGTPVTLINNTGFAYETLTAFSIAYGEADQNDAGFQISNNGTDWYWWNGSAWVETTGNDYNNASTINSNISSFSTQVGSGTFYFKAFMLTDGTKQVDLASVTLTAASATTAPVTTVLSIKKKTSYLSPLAIIEESKIDTGAIENTPIKTKTSEKSNNFGKNLLVYSGVILGLGALFVGGRWLFLLIKKRRSN
ncbi:MAG: Fibronectin, type III protein [Candidatus Berkelbacteria bacterium Athens1014_28]|uniref:Fibronectin, type III protein n=1 Tax=Candidatus Berkelbacteria bacterium Athens1014_28 TaxID=2017145 RepID=A0A554LN84_9BACT|nr:MAG: Fibronectin, type III protein [Candidatus Berkelbacteria bacterium Athens1014_28]